MGDRITEYTAVKKYDEDGQDNNRSGSKQKSKTRLVVVVLVVVLLVVMVTAVITHVKVKSSKHVETSGKSYIKYKDCKVYGENDERPDHVCRYCTRSSDSNDNNEYCREYVCAPSACDSPLKGENDCCSSCPGTCNYGGRIYHLGDSFSCLDGVNRCTCIGTGVVTTTTNTEFTHDDTCKPKRYGVCSLYETWEQKDRFKLQNECITGTVFGSQVEACKEYLCAVDNYRCDTGDRVKNENNDCYSCPGYCNYGGRNYVVNESFICIDGIHVCSCVRTGKVEKHIRGLPKLDIMCKPPKAKYQDCRVYAEGEEKSDNVCRYCTRSFDDKDKNEYCREYNCAPVNCRSPVKGEKECCASCPGTCNYGGRIYYVGDAFTCLDGGNHCFCCATGVISSTWNEVSHDVTCNSQRYGACVLYNVWEQKDRNVQQGECITGYLSGSQVVACKEHGCNKQSFDFHCKSENKVQNEDDKCYSCPGTCNYGGREYRVNRTFACIDGVNNCICARTGKVVKTSSIQPSIYKMCKTYGDRCVAYSQSEEKDPTKYRYCEGDHRRPWTIYCREYTCVKTECEGAKQFENQRCAFCPGTCNYGGKVYNVSEMFGCLDGVNFCHCTSAGNIYQTRMGGPTDAACFSHFSLFSKT